MLSGWCETVCGEQDKRGNSGEEWQVCWPDLIITTTDVMVNYGRERGSTVWYGLVYEKVVSKVWWDFTNGMVVRYCMS